MSEKPMLSVVTICMNIADSIRKTCQSVVSQTWTDFEWIVVDGGSTDGTLDILKEYKNDMRQFISEDDTGPYCAMNKGIRASSGKWIIFMNGGDYFINGDILGKIFKNKTYDDADILFGHVEYEKGGKIYERSYAPQEDRIDDLFFAYDGIDGQGLNHQGTFIRRDLFSRHGLYDERYKIVGDWERFAAFSKTECRFKRLDEVVAVFNREGVSACARDEDSLFRREHRMGLRDNFTEDELVRAKKRFNKANGQPPDPEEYSTKAFCFPIKKELAVFSIQETGNRRKRKYCFMNAPVFTARSREIYEHRIFGFLPLSIRIPWTNLKLGFYGKKTD